MMRKKRIITAILSVVISTLFVFPVQALTIINYNKTDYTVQTPNGTVANAWKATNELSEEDKAFLRTSDEEQFPDIEFLAEPSGDYNCHSYAWYQRSSTNEIWLPDIEEYLADPTYIETTTPAVGDIVVYFTPAGNTNHSGVIDEILSGTSNGICGDVNLYMVVSKWAQEALYRHRGDRCRFVREYGGSCSYVKYYHRHSYRYTNKTAYTHTVECGCMEPLTEQHTWVQFSELLGYRCTVCNYRSNFIPANPENVSAEIWMQLMAKVAVEDGATFILDDMVFCYMDGQYYIVTEYAPDVVITPNIIE